ncbi:EXS-domain-containing protein [Hypoxylon fuscum]|nr:EXS-domain-containing protein [Hypoxylon fuscum]
MDFSFFQPETRHRFLRDILGLKRRWLYYGIMVLDPILRFGWIFYAIFTHDKQHSTLVSFLVALAEVARRGMWALFRVENEHCSNVAQYKASRDVPLPYPLPSHEPLVERVSTEEEERRNTTTSVPAQLSALPTEGATASAVDLSTVGASALGREHTGGQTESHARTQSQEQPPSDDRVDLDLAEEDELRSEEEDDDDDTGSMIDERMEVRREHSLVRGEANAEDSV